MVSEADEEGLTRRSSGRRTVLRGSSVARRRWHLLALGACLAGSVGVSTAGQPPPGSPTVLRFGFCNAMIEDVAPSDALAAVKVWARAIGRVAGWESADGVILPSADAALNAVNSGNTDFVALPTIEYLTIERSLAADPCLTYMAYGEVEVEYVLLTHRETRSLQELRGKKVAVYSPTGVRNLPETWLDVLLLESGLPEKERTFQQVRPVKKASQAILPLFFKQVDAAVVTRSAFATAVELNPQLGADIVVLTQSQRLLPGLICVRRALDQQIRRRWLEGAVRLHQNAESRQTFMVLKVNRLMAWEPRYLDNARALVNRYVHLKGAVGSQ